MGTHRHHFLYLLCYGHTYVYIWYNFTMKGGEELCSCTHASDERGRIMSAEGRVVMQKHKPKQALKYLAEEAVEDIRIRVPKGQKAV